MFTVLSSVFSENEKHEIHTQEGWPLKTSRFFFLPGEKLSVALFRANPILSEKVRFEKPLRQKTLFLPRNFGKGSKNRRQNREERHEETRLNSTFAASFFCQSSVSGKGPSSKTISRKTRFDNWSLQSSDETLRKLIFLENPNSRPHYRTPAGPIIEPMNRKIRPHYRSRHIYIYLSLSLSLSSSISLSLSLLCFALSLSQPAFKREMHIGEGCKAERNLATVQRFACPFFFGGGG